MKFNMICTKFDHKIKKNLKNLNFGLFRFFKNLNKVFSKPSGKLTIREELLGYHNNNNNNYNNYYYNNSDRIQ